MTREELKALGVADDVIGKIMDINGSDINKTKDKYSTLQTQLDTANGKITDYEKEIGELKKVDGAGLQHQAL